VYLNYRNEEARAHRPVALVLPATAAAKGPSKAAIAGAGVTTIRISGAEGSSTPFWRFVEAAGWFEAAWGPSRLPQTPPQGELGPRYTITWTVPSSSKLYQDVYPYAKRYPVTYMPRGQKIWGTPVKGGWFVGGAKLKKALTRVGIPAQAPQPPPAAASHTPLPAQHASGSGLSALDLGAIAAAVVLVALALFVAIRAIRRPRRTIAA
jgi:hypothetical protein